MRVYISNYRNHWISPYTILEKICFWEKDKDIFYNLNDDPNNKYIKIVEILDYFCVGLQKFLNFVHPRVEYVKIDKYDTWSMDTTLAKIVLPMLKQLKETKHGSAMVAMEDVPEHLRAINHEDYDEQLSFEFYHEHEVKENDRDIHARWDWVMGEMIFAFEHLLDDSWEEEFRSGVIDWKSVPCSWDENGKPSMYSMEYGPNHTFKCDYEGMEKVQKRIQNGLRLFGTYYTGLWD
jgi:hypothetical protein